MFIPHSDEFTVKTKKHRQSGAFFILFFKFAKKVFAYAFDYVVAVFKLAAFDKKCRAVGDTSYDIAFVGSFYAFHFGEAFFHKFSYPFGKGKVSSGKH